MGVFSDDAALRQTTTAVTGHRTPQLWVAACYNALAMTMHSNAMDSNEFVARLDEEIGAALARLGEMSAAGDAPEILTSDKLLRLALKNELEATELAAIWLATTEELDVKLA